MTRRITVNLAEQRLYVWEPADDGMPRQIARYLISSAALGAGERQGSFQTPRGRHQITEKIGGEAPIHAVFRARQPTGVIWSAESAAHQPGQDWILSRILWLSGLEPGKNLGGEVDTHARYIYIHGTADEARLGTPVSHGCIRMGNADIIELFEMIDVGTVVDIVEA